MENILRALWKVVFADGIEQEEEDAVLHRIEDLFGISPQRAKELHDEVIPPTQG